MNPPPTNSELRETLPGTRGERACGAELSTQQTSFFSRNRKVFSHPIWDGPWNGKKNQQNDLQVFGTLRREAPIPKKYLRGLKSAGYCLTPELLIRMLLRARGGNTACIEFDMTPLRHARPFGISDSNRCIFRTRHDPLTCSSIFDPRLSATALCSCAVQGGRC